MTSLASSVQLLRDSDGCVGFDMARLAQVRASYVVVDVDVSCNKCQPVGMNLAKLYLNSVYECLSVIVGIILLTDEE